MAMKEIQIQPGETRAIKNVAEELKIFEGISHKHLVKLYGVEIHRVRMPGMSTPASTYIHTRFFSIFYRKNY